MSIQGAWFFRLARAVPFLAVAVSCGAGTDPSVADRSTVDRSMADQGTDADEGMDADQRTDADEGADDAAPAVDAASTTSVIQVIFVIVMENHDASRIYGNTTDAPYINGTLIPSYARSNNFNDELANLPSEPHYIWMEAGTNAFSDHTFTSDAAPSASNSTGSTEHLVTQIQTADSGVTWLSYQEGINGATGTCPIATSGFYRPKHDPFVFFQDVSGSPPSKTDENCASHHKDFSVLAADLANGTVASYNFITPNQCHDMHGQRGCPQSNRIRSGDDWLSTNLPAIISFVNANSGVIFLTWDEGARTQQMPFLAIGPHVKAGFSGSVSYGHSSLLKSVERILNLPVLPTVASANELSDLFEPGFYP